MNITNVSKKNLVKHGYKNLEEWLLDPNHIYIGRNMSFAVKGAVGSKWQNPFKVKDYGLDKCLELYEKHIRTNPILWNSLNELQDKELGCWCFPKKCHGDILIKLVNEKLFMNSLKEVNMYNH